MINLLTAQIIIKLTQNNIKSIRNYAEVVERQIELKSDEILHSLAQTTDGFTLEEIDFEWENWRNQIRDVDIAYPTLLRYSLVTSIYSTLEQALMRLHNAYRHRLTKQQNSNSTGELEDILIPTYKKYKKREYIDKLGEGMSDIQAVGLYISEEIGINFPHPSQEWNFILNLRHIRNNITHCNGRIPEHTNPLQIQKIINDLGHNLIKTSGSQEIILKKAFTTHMLNQVEAFLNNLLDAVESNLSSSL